MSATRPLIEDVDWSSTRQRMAADALATFLDEVWSGDSLPHG